MYSSFVWQTYCFMSLYYLIRNQFLIFLSFVFYPILYLVMRGRRREVGDAPRILVIPQLTRVGDLVCSTPVFLAIKKKYPKSFLAVLVTRKVAGIIKNNPYIDEIIYFQTKGYSNILQNVGILKFDWGVCLTPTFMGTVTMMLGLIPNRVKITREGRSLGEFFSDWLCQFRFLYKDHTYLPKFYLKLLEPLGIFSQDDKKDVFVSDEGERKAEEFVANRKSQIANRTVGISITAGNKIKEWGDDKFAELAKRIVEKYNARIVFIGSKNDEERIKTLIGRLKGSPSTLLGDYKYLVPEPVEGQPFVPVTNFSLEELPSLMKRLDLYIAVDTGPIYIAEALGVPLVDIIGPVDPNEQPPCGKPHCICVLPKATIKPSSFVFKRSGRAEEHKKALDATSVEMVMDEVDKLI